MKSKRPSLLALIGPGILVAGTGVGAGDLATAAFSGAAVGITILWAVLLGSAMKYAINEGLARWQLATGTTLLEGVVRHLGRGAGWIFLAYLLFWSFMVGSALMSAIGAVGHAIWPVFGEHPAAAANNKILFGLAHSAVAVAMVRWGGYQLFEKVMHVCIAVMVVVVLMTAVALRPPIDQVISGLLVPRIPAGGRGWTVALMGGVGGTVTVLCYGYWIREEGRRGGQALRTCRIDLACGYCITALFGVAMVIIGGSLGAIEGSGVTLVVRIANQLQSALGTLGPAMRWLFLIGAWGAVFTSLLGVWQSVPYLFADLWRLQRPAATATQAETVGVTARPYRLYLYALATVPALGLINLDFRLLQKWNAVVGALFIPLLTVVLLVLNGRSAWVGPRYRNGLWATLALAATLAFFGLAGWAEISEKLGRN